MNIQTVNTLNIQPGEAALILRRRLQLNHAEVARIVCVHPNTIVAVENNRARPATTKQVLDTLLTLWNSDPASSVIGNRDAIAEEVTTKR